MIRAPIRYGHLYAAAFGLACAVLLTWARL